MVKNGVIGAVFMFLTLFSVNISGASSKKDTPKLYGKVQYRVRGDIESEHKKITTIGYDTTITKNYVSHKIAYHFGFTTTLNRTVLFHMRMGNHSTETETVLFNPNGSLKNPFAKNTQVYPYFHLAYAQFKLVHLKVSAGIVPVKSRGPLDLIAVSKPLGSYEHAAFESWATVSDGSHGGLKVGYNILRDDFKLSVEIFGTMFGKSRPSLAETFWVLSVPMKKNKITMVPQIVLLSNRHHYTGSTTGKGDWELAWGGDVVAHFTKKMSMKFLFAMAHSSNSRSRDNMSDIEKRTQLGIIGGVNLSYKIGKKGKVLGGYRFSVNSRDLRESPDGIILGATDTYNDFYHYIDVKYSYKIHPYFSIMPRTRMFISRLDRFNKKDVHRKIVIRPELIFTSSF